MGEESIPTKFPYLVIKPWGREIWLEVNDRYCFKELFIKAGERTSFQYHERKRETLYVISGRLGVILENERGKLEEIFLESGGFLTVIPPRKHRMFATEKNAHYLEASYPDVYDVIRIQDDSGRKDGKIEAEH